MVRKRDAVRCTLILWSSQSAEALISCGSGANCDFVLIVGGIWEAKAKGKAPAHKETKVRYFSSKSCFYSVEWRF